MPNQCEQFRRELEEITKSYQELQEQAKSKNLSLKELRRISNRLDVLLRKVEEVKERVFHRIEEFIKEGFEYIDFYFQVEGGERKLVIKMKPNKKYYRVNLKLKRGYLDVLKYIEKIERSLDLRAYNGQDLIDIEIPEVEGVFEEEGIYLEEVNSLSVKGEVVKLIFYDLQKAVDLNFSNCTNLKRLDLGNLKEYQELKLPEDLEELSLGIEQAEILDFRQYPQLKKLDLSNLKEYQELKLPEDLEELSLGIEQAEILEFKEDLQLKELYLLNLKEVGELKLPSSLKKIILFGLAKANILDFSQCVNLTSLQFGRLSEVGELKLPSNLEMVFFIHLVKAGRLDFSQCKLIQEFILNKLEEVKELIVPPNSKVSLKKLPLNQIEKLLKNCQEKGLMNIKFEFTISQKDKDRLNEEYADNNFVIL